MRSFRSKPTGWQYESHRHYLAAKGIPSKRYLVVKTGLGKFIQGAFEKREEYAAYGDAARNVRIQQEQRELAARIAEEKSAQPGLTPEEKAKIRQKIAEARLRAKSIRTPAEERVALQRERTKDAEYWKNIAKEARMNEREKIEVAKRAAEAETAAKVAKTEEIFPDDVPKENVARRVEDLDNIPAYKNTQTGRVVVVGKRKWRR